MTTTPTIHSDEPCRKVVLHRERLARLRERYVWNEEEACKAVAFIEKNLKHWKEPFSGKPFILSDWQRDDIVRPLWGLRNPDGTRVFRRAYIQIPRKNGKSALVAALMLLILCTDGKGLEIYTAATKRDQAMIVFKDCQAFVRASPRLRARLRLYQQKIQFADRMSVLQPLSSDYNNLDGLNVSAAAIDELHAHRSAHLHDVIVTATGTRSQPLVICITTAGEETQGVCHDQYEYAANVLEGNFEDDTFFAYVAEADAELNWDDPRAYRQANPNLGVSIRENYLQQELERAKQMPSYRKVYEKYHLNRWVQTGAVTWLPTAAWARCKRTFTLAEMKGLKCYGGLDLSSTTDLTALSLLFPMPDKSIRLWTRYYCPEETMHQRAREDNVPYDVWAQQGWITPTPGNVVDYAFIVADVQAIRKAHQLKLLSYDDWNGVSVYTELERQRVEMAKFIQGLRSFHPPSYEFEKRVLEGSLHHDGNPVTAWMAGHVKVSRDASGKMRPVKDHKSDKKRIDGIVASIMGLDGLLRQEGVKQVDYQGIPADFRGLLGL